METKAGVGWGRELETWLCPGGQGEKEKGARSVPWLPSTRHVPGASGELQVTFRSDFLLDLKPVICFNLVVGKIPWRRQCLPTPVVLPGEFHGQTSLVGPRPRGSKTRTRLSDHHCHIHSH